MANYKKDHDSYLREKQVSELFEALTAGLVHHRPEDHCEFLRKSLDHVKDIGVGNLRWDTFVTYEPEVRHENVGSDHRPPVSKGGVSQETNKEGESTEFDLLNIGMCSFLCLGNN